MVYMKINWNKMIPEERRPAFDAIVQGLQEALTEPSNELANQLTEEMTSIARLYNLTVDEFEIARIAAESGLKS